ncbi:MAG: hypothetical protein HN764_07620 [Gammaproteobacteria bacterium]|jgi:MSHA biogenesis protein MshK|nr:hypothetical protein [Gammaproteobacteria bacterium]
MIKVIFTMFLLFSAITLRADVDLPDPTRPADYSVAVSVKQARPKTRAEFNLNAVRISADDRSAIVNGRLVRVGDDIGTAKVKEINIQNIVLDYERKMMTVPLYANGISKLYRDSERKN